MRHVFLACILSFSLANHAAAQEATPPATETLPRPAATSPETGALSALLFEVRLLRITLQNTNTGAKRVQLAGERVIAGRPAMRAPTRSPPHGRARTQATGRAPRDPFLRKGRAREWATTRWCSRTHLREISGSRRTTRSRAWNPCQAALPAWHSILEGPGAHGAGFRPG